MPEDFLQREVRVMPALSRQERAQRARSRQARMTFPVGAPDDLTDPKASAPAASVEKRSVTIEAKPVERKKLRVAAYCRVSTNNAEQETSIAAQREHYETVINDKPDWELADIYWEAGVSGTRAEKRPELQRLIADCEAGRVDLVLTKSISRFARNTTECLEIVRMLMGLGVRIVFEKKIFKTAKTLENKGL